MSFRVNVDEQDGYLRVDAEGKWSLGEILELIDQISTESRDRNNTPVVLDMRKVAGDPTNMERLRVGQHIADALGSRIQVAAILRTEMINWFAEDVAVRSGANVKVFSLEDDAIEWLTETETGS